jgi:gamma-glutamylcyclotransferase (GGCT)/AIG2-like uncharacterized protein YtfP
MATHTLFVYGTLCDPDIRAAVLGRRWRGALPGRAFAPGHRVVYYPGRLYPALHRAAGARAIGKILCGLNERDLAVLDAFEGTEYRRAPVRVMLAGRTVRAEAYLPNIPLGYGTRPWRLATWQARHKGAERVREARLALHNRQTTTIAPH